MAKVALMCGHGKSKNGSWDAGTTYKGYTEAGLMLPITKAAVKYLRAWGVTVISDADTNNNKNMLVDVAWANREKATIYVSVHCDYSKAPSGVMPLYVSDKGKKLASALNSSIKNGMPMKSRGVVRRTDLWELNGTDMPACILETGAIKADLGKLKNDPDKYGELIAKGICSYLGITQKESTPAPKKEELYRVRHSWNEPATQAGAFKDLANAKKLADQKHLNVYSSNGKLVYSGKAPAPKPAPKPTTWQDKANAWAKKIADSKYHYNKWKAGDKKTQTCPICKGRKYDDHYGWNCIGFAWAVWHHGGGLKNKCNCHVIDNGNAEKILKASSDAKALALVQSKCGLKTIKVIRSKKGVSKSKWQKGDICLMFKGNTYIHTFYYMGGGKVADAGNYSDKAKQIKVRDYKNYTAKVIIRYTGK